MVLAVAEVPEVRCAYPDGLAVLRVRLAEATMIDASQRLDFIKYRGRTFAEVRGLLTWLWKNYAKAVRDGHDEAAETIRALAQTIEDDSP